MGYSRHTNQLELNTTSNEVFNVLWNMKKQGYSEYTINFVRKALKVLEEGFGLIDPDKVKSFIALRDAADSRARSIWSPVFTSIHIQIENEMT